MEGPCDPVVVVSATAHGKVLHVPERADALALARVLQGVELAVPGSAQIGRPEARRTNKT